MIRSKALEENIARHHVEVTPDPKYDVFREIMAEYHGLLENLNAFIEELSHPYRNWQYIVKEARMYSLNYFHLMKQLPAPSDAPGGREAPGLPTARFPMPPDPPS